ncbi:Toxic component of toxin-antitoxin system, dsRBD-like fold, HicA family [Halapricum desulfuricans]|uniref:Toxic component of toxin-antitoxin system, dsRBD-like fold, HicA family n=1 Tax=Halapricum desulfuricans TaxID=2841257 RepID=A0A897N9H8_9EURY|nr:Toxic component of toxin-antitoxin system, dsRBD-like fold, HicA family [Halapricum desulfuricans]
MLTRRFNSADYAGWEVPKALTKNRFHIVDRTGSHVSDFEAWCEWIEGNI